MNALPKDLLITIFSFLDPRTIILCSRVNKPWKTLITESLLLIIKIRLIKTKNFNNKDVVFGGEKWFKFYNLKVLEQDASMPLSLLEVFNNEKIIQSHSLIYIPKITLQAFVNLKGPIDQHIQKDILEQYGSLEVKKPYWILVLNKPCGLNQLDSEQESIIVDLSQTNKINYRLPNILEAMISFTAKDLLGTQPYNTYIASADKMNDHRVIVGHDISCIGTHSILTVFTQLLKGYTRIHQITGITPLRTF
jgi:hypothetical protein